MKAPEEILIQELSIAWDLDEQEVKERKVEAWFKASIKAMEKYAGVWANSQILKDVTVVRLQQKIDELNKMEGRANALEEWLTEYRDQLKKENVYHKNTGIINAINELLNE